MGSTITATHKARGPLEALTALPTYLGSKRKLVELVFAAVAEVIPKDRWSGSTLVDPFAGSCSIALAANAHGFRVLANDAAERAHVLAKAYIANSSVWITPIDVGFLCREPAGAYARVCEEHLVPGTFRLVDARRVDRMLHQARCLPEPKCSLAMALLMKALVGMQPMGVFDASDAKAANTDDFDHLSDPRLAHFVRSRGALTPTRLLRLAEVINRGVIPGSGAASCLDATEFLGRVQGDVVYLDPPYAGTTAYEHAYAALDLLFEGRTRTVSSFSQDGSPLPELLKATSHVPHLVLSYGNTRMTTAELERLVARSSRRIVRTVEIPYRHLGALATRRKNLVNREVLIVATNA